MTQIIEFKPHKKTFSLQMGFGNTSAPVPAPFLFIFPGILFASITLVRTPFARERE